jgi:hypothetical protein
MEASSSGDFKRANEGLEHEIDERRKTIVKLEEIVNILVQRARLWVTPGRGKFALPTEGARKVVPMFFIYRTGLSVLDVSLSVPDILHIFGSYPNLSLLYQHSILWPKNCCPSMACSLTF